MKDYETIRIEHPQDHTVLVTINRPDVANAMNTQMGLDLLDAFDGFCAAPNKQRCIVITGAGARAFCAGGDLKQRLGMTDEQWQDQHLIFERMVRAMIGCPVPIIAAVNGAAYAGGMEIALCADFIYAAEHARFALTEVTLGIMPGADPKLETQVVILSAHLDHIGISKPKPDDTPETDKINNGALDNASGIATMLEVARAFAASPDKPRRTLVFLASTAEEKGLLGADYYAQNPTVPLKSIVADVDLDMPLLLYPFTSVIAFGADHSTVGKVVAEAAAPMGIALEADPMPQEGIFTRSDHYQFVKQGVPAVFLATGFANGGGAQWEKFLSGNYHHPGDDLNQPIDWKAGARFAEVNYRITRALADDPLPPLWYKGDFFGDAFAPNAAKAAAR